MPQSRPNSLKPLVSSPAAAYDALCIVEGLKPDFGSLHEVEVQTVAYLASLLSLSEGQQSEQWGYSFAATAIASPISVELTAAIAQLTASGLIFKDASKVTAASDASVILRSWASLPGNSRRQPFLDAAISATRAISLPLAIRAVHREPQLASAGLLGLQRNLPDELALPELLEDLGEVDSVLVEHGLHSEAGKRRALLLNRAHLWLSYLATEAEPGVVQRGAEPSLA
jgi:hypothetical protein